MGLTPEQVRQIKSALQCSRPDVLYPGAITLAIEALDAYERVKALLEEWERREPVCSEAAMNQLRRALYGEE